VGAVEPTTSLEGASSGPKFRAQKEGGRKTRGTREKDPRTHPRGTVLGTKTQRRLGAKNKFLAVHKRGHGVEANEGSTEGK